MKKKYPKFPVIDSEMTIAAIIRQYPKTDSCEIQTLGELRDWQIAELKKLFLKLLIENKEEIFLQRNEKDFFRNLIEKL